ncbi:hypothetical protein, partial [Antarctobacter jejuensis]|uniref:hypothetical protein n=1 Tax=Antarctobacter jejuensis TaxID=1439938 RepID=UPI003FD364D3
PRNHPQCTFPIVSATTPAASSFRGLSTRADARRTPAVTQRPASKNLQDSGPSLQCSRKLRGLKKRTFGKANTARLISEHKIRGPIIRCCCNEFQQYQGADVQLAENRNLQSLSSTF